MAVFWDVAPCSLVGTDRRFRGVTARRNIPEDSHLHTYRRENLKSHIRLLITKIDIYSYRQIS
jgi:hypothetical protein